MAHFAQLDSTNRVTHVSVVADAKLDPANEEASGIAYLQRIHGPSTWLQTSFNGTIRGRFAGVGFIYDEARDAFLKPQPFPSWTLNESTTEWEPPTPKPAHSSKVSPLWDEPSLSWKMLLSKNDFDDRFTQTEWTAIDDSTIPEVRRLRAKAFWLASHIDLTDQRVIDGVNALELIGLIGSGRAAIILDPNA